MKHKKGSFMYLNGSFASPQMSHQLHRGHFQQLTTLEPVDAGTKRCMWVNSLSMYIHNINLVISNPLYSILQCVTLTVRGVQAYNYVYVLHTPDFWFDDLACSFATSSGGIGLLCPLWGSDTELTELSWGIYRDTNQSPGHIPESHSN